MGLQVSGTFISRTEHIQRSEGKEIEMIVPVDARGLEKKFTENYTGTKKTSPVWSREREGGEL